ncbi:MAG: response regulator [Gammaproteobacteria bacterium]|nr:response regulator [Gammaproteobacteria bacterium]
MSLKLKLVLSFVLVASIGLAFSVATIYQSSITAFHSNYQVLLQELAQDILQQPQEAELLNGNSYAVFRQSRSGNLEPLLNTQQLDPGQYFESETGPDKVVLPLSRNKYQWYASERNEQGQRIIILHRSQPYNFSTFFTDYGTEISIIILFTIWLVFWAALIVYSLINKINHQKEQLESQASELNQKSEEAIETTRTKSKFLANISHEMRTPLTAIIGYSETLLHSDQPMQERLSSINTIIRNGNHLLSLINDLLDLSKIEAGKFEVESIPVNITQIMQDIESLFIQQAKTKGIELKLNYHFPIPETIHSDPVRLKQIIINLVSNALKFTKSGYIHIDIKQLDKNTLQIQVEDTGVGMTKEQISKIFQDYAQAESSTTRKYGGTGLGLSLSKLLSNMLGGDITVSSLPGLGSIFSLTVACGDTSDSRQLNQVELKATQSEQQLVPSITQKLKGSILLAEDNPDNQHLFSMYLKRFGVKTDVVHNGQQAIEYALRTDYDLILMDMQMPIMDGVEATHDLRSKGVNTPIIALTASTLEDDMEEFFSAGCTDYLSKPIKRERLYELCSQYLQADIQGETLSPMHSSVLEEDPDFIDLVARFARRLPETIERFRSLCEAKEYSILAKEAHDLKGVGGNMGYAEVSELAGKLEFQIANKNAAETLHLINQLNVMHQQIEQGLEKFAKS